MKHVLLFINAYAVFLIRLQNHFSGLTGRTKPFNLLVQVITLLLTDFFLICRYYIFSARMLLLVFQHSQVDANQGVRERNSV